MVFSINPTAEKTQAMFQSLAIQQNGTGEATPITGGNAGENPPPAQSSEATPAQNSETPPAQGEQPPPAGATPGQGTVGADGSCTCVVSCNPGGFPANAQGVGATGGFGGKLLYHYLVSKKPS